MEREDKPGAPPETPEEKPKAGYFRGLFGGGTKEKLEQLERAYEKTAAEKAALAETLEREAAGRRDLSEKLAHAEEVIGSMRVQILDADQRAAQLEKRMAQELERLRALERDRSTAEEALRSKIVEQERAVVRAETAQKQVEVALAKRDREQKVAEIELKQLRARLATLEQLQKERDAARAALSSSQEKNGSLEQQLIRSAQELAEIRALHEQNTAEATERAGRFSELQRQAAEAERRAAAAEARAAAAEARAAAAEARASDLEAIPPSEMETLLSERDALISELEAALIAQRAALEDRDRSPAAT